MNEPKEVTLLDLKLKYLARYLNQKARVTENTRYSLNEGKFNDVLHKSQEYTISPIILTICQDNENVLNNLQIHLKNPDHIPDDKLNEWVTLYGNDVHDYMEYMGFYTGKWMGVDPEKENWVVVEK